MKFSVVSLFPELFESFVRTSLVGKAIQSGRAEVDIVWLREFGFGKHRSVDDTPYGGGAGMVIRVDAVVAALEHVDAGRQGEGRAHRILLSPQGKPFSQPIAERLSEQRHVTMVCGRYEGFDDRVSGFVDEQISLGDFVMTGGELAAMAIIDTVVRLLPGVLGNPASIHAESFSGSGQRWLEYPQFTRPAEFRGVKVPDVLTSGDHGEISRWRTEESARRTQLGRPDLIKLPERT